MKQMRIWVFLVIGLAAMSGVAQAQKTPVRKPTPKPPATSKTVPPLEVRTAKEKATTQRDNVNFWIDKLGPVAEALELLDGTYATKKPSPTTLATHEERKKKFIPTLRNLHDDTALLESEFRTKSSLQKYLVTVRGVTDLAAQSEDLAIAGKFVASKQPLREASKKLTDTLAAMP